MLLEISILLINVFSKNILVLIGLSIFLLILNFRFDKDFFIKLKKIAKFMLIYLFYCIISVVFYKNGVIIMKVGNFYITQEGLNISLIKLLTLNNFFLLSLLLSAKIRKNSYKIDIKHPKFEKIKSYYSDVFRVIFDTIPFILQLIKEKVKFSDSYKKILLKVYRNL